MIRKIVQIDEEKCSGCGLCAAACQEGAIAMVDGKAKLIRDDYCDGLGNCLPACPAGAISIVEREAEAYEQKETDAPAAEPKSAPHAFAGCPGSMARALNRPKRPAAESQETGPVESELMQWPVQIKLVPVNASYFGNANLLVAADCTAYAYASFHREFMKNHIVLIGCPKLDTVDYAEKLTQIIKNNTIKSVKVVRMQVPCCCGIENAVKQALIASGKMIPWQVVVISTDGRIVEE